MNTTKFLNGEITYDYAKDLTWDFILENQIASEDALHLVTNINGYNMETLNDVLYSNTGYHDIKQLWDCEKENFYFSDDIVENIESPYFNEG